jgi:hypothetical protein
MMAQRSIAGSRFSCRSCRTVVKEPVTV